MTPGRRASTSRVRVASVNIGIFGCDPGGATGNAWGIFDPGHPEGVEGALRDRQHFGSSTITGDERAQIRAVSALWKDFYSACVVSACLPPQRVWFVMEDFVLRPGETGGGREMGISTAIIWGVEGYRLGQADEWARHKRGNLHIPPMILQPAGQAKGYATNKRLRIWDFWVVGREHERSACQHIAYFLKRYMQQNHNG